jgi:hypothetical protein
LVMFLFFPTFGQWKWNRSLVRTLPTILAMSRSIAAFQPHLAKSVPSLSNWLLVWVAINCWSVNCWSVGSKVPLWLTLP